MIDRMRWGCVFVVVAACGPNVPVAGGSSDDGGTVATNISRTTPVPIAIDFDGFVWNAHLFDQQIQRLDPSSGSVDVVGGIAFPDVQGDMTGTALALVSGQI
jgi:streptogramin lyase